MYARVVLAYPSTSPYFIQGINIYIQLQAFPDTIFSKVL